MQPKRKSVETRYLEERQEFYDALKRLDRRSFIKVSAAAMGAAAFQGLMPPNSFQPIASRTVSRCGESPAGSASRTSPIPTCT